MLDALAIYKERATLELKRQNRKDIPDMKVVNEKRRVIDDITKQ